MAETIKAQCGHCGATLLPGRRFCVACLAQTPKEARPPAGPVAEAMRQIPSTHRPDKTLVFVPERHEARLQRQRRNGRALLAVGVCCLLLALAGFAYWRARVRQQAAARQQHRESLARRELDLYAHALDLFHADFGRYPAAQEGLAALVRRPTTLSGWRGPYIEGDYSVDPWGNEYVYRVFDNGAGYQLFSYGPEGETAARIFLQVRAGAASSP